LVAFGGGYHPSESLLGAIDESTKALPSARELDLIRQALYCPAAKKMQAFSRTP
jgi:hypothetical protein